ncbi:MAG: hypothetical protein MUO76_22880 [Anaerolineaceae bacterium]|nr:hypothetical protein [Anaerolineaceae bacterium]
MSDFDINLLFNNMSEGFCMHELIYNKAGKAIDYSILEVNSVYEKMLSINRDKAVGSRASDLYGTAEPPYLNIYSRVVGTGTTEEIEIYFPPMEKFFMIRTFAIDGDKFATLFIDITARAQVEDELVEHREHLKDLVKERTEELEEKINKQREILGFWAGREVRMGEMKVIIKKLHEQLEDAGLEPEIDDSFLREETMSSFLYPPV